MKCPHCKKELGQGDSYDLMISHRWDLKQANDILIRLYGKIGVEYE
jgi:hypothetical protein